MAVRLRLRVLRVLALFDAFGLLVFVGREEVVVELRTPRTGLVLRLGRVVVRAVWVVGRCARRHDLVVVDDLLRDETQHQLHVHAQPLHLVPYHGLLVHFAWIRSGVYLLLQRLRKLNLEELLVLLCHAHYLLAVQGQGVLHASRVLRSLVLPQQVEEHLEGVVLQLRDENGVDLAVFVSEKARAIKSVHVGQQGERLLLEALLLLRRQVLAIYLFLILCLQQLQLVPKLPVFPFDALLVVLVIVGQEALELLGEFFVTLKLEQDALDEGIWINI